MAFGWMEYVNQGGQGARGLVGKEGEGIEGEMILRCCVGYSGIK